MDKNVGPTDANHSRGRVGSLPLKTIKFYLVVGGIHDSMVTHFPQFNTVIIQRVQLEVFDPQLW